MLMGSSDPRPKSKFRFSTWTFQCAAATPRPLQAFAALLLCLPFFLVFFQGKSIKLAWNRVSRNLALKGTTKATGQGPGSDIIS